ncbi:MAG TPA: metal-dependent transcriptional regulator, partial [Anaerolineales bacterium]|nr:metal-dependent transcriptional regulator [Anaerolineales bacterium]
MPNNLSDSIEDYLKAIYKLQQNESPVSTNALAAELAIMPASVTGMLKKLAEHQPAVVEYRRHHGVLLTPAGEKIALEVLRHHRLIELYLMEALGYRWDEVHAEAERLEHVISEEFEERIARFLG